MTAKLINKDYIRGYLRGAEERGFNTSAILSDAGLAHLSTSGSNDTIDGIQLQQFFISLIRQTNDFGMAFMREPTKPAVFAELARVTSGHKTIGSALYARSRFWAAVRSDVEFKAPPGTHQHTTGYCPSYSNVFDYVDQDLLYFFRVCMSYKFLSWLIGETIQLDSVHLSSAPLPFMDECQRLFNCEVKYNQPGNWMVYSDKYLSRPVARTEAELLAGDGFLLYTDFTKKHPDWFSMPGQAKSTAEQVENALGSLHNLGAHSPRIEAIAEMLALNTHTLRKRLAKENKSYLQVKNTFRQKLAEDKLADPEMSVTEVAEALGFLEPSDFARAFKSWTNMSPTEYRLKHIA